jgi:hypothetical protein
MRLVVEVTTLVFVEAVAVARRDFHGDEGAEGHAASIFRVK